MKGKVVIITGASSGIGRALAIRFAKAGCKLVITGRNGEKMKVTTDLLNSMGLDHLSLISDVSIIEDCKSVIDQTINKFGRIDILVNNAGVSMRGLLSETDIGVLKKVMDTNFWGTVYFTKLALPYLIPSKGSIVGVSSIAGKKGLPGRSAYSSSKFAIEGFLETVRMENMKNGLHVLVACPGFTASEIRNSALGPDGKPQGESPRNEGRMMTAEKVADLIFKAVVLRKRDLILTFNGRLVVLLNKFFPGLMDRMVYDHLAKEADSPFK